MSSSKSATAKKIEVNPEATVEPALLTLGVEVRRRRQAAGLTLEQLAERAGLTPNYIGTIEHGRRDPSLSTLIALSRALNIAVSEFFAPPPRPSEDAMLMATSFQDMPPELRSSVLELLRTIARRKRS